MEAAHGGKDLACEVGFVGDGHATNGIGLEMVPDKFIRIAVGGIRRKIKELQFLTKRCDKVFCFLGTMRGTSIDNFATALSRKK